MQATEDSGVDALRTGGEVDPKNTEAFYEDPWIQKVLPPELRQTPRFMQSGKRGGAPILSRRNKRFKALGDKGVDDGNPPPGTAPPGASTGPTGTPIPVAPPLPPELTFKVRGQDLAYSKAPQKVKYGEGTNSVELSRVEAGLFFSAAGIDEKQDEDFEGRLNELLDNKELQKKVPGLQEAVEKKRIKDVLLDAFHKMDPVKFNAMQVQAKLDFRSIPTASSAGGGFNISGNISAAGLLRLGGGVVQGAASRVAQAFGPTDEPAISAEAKAKGDVLENHLITKVDKYQINPDSTEMKFLVKAAQDDVLGVGPDGELALTTAAPNPIAALGQAINDDSGLKGEPDAVQLVLNIFDDLIKPKPGASPAEIQAAARRKKELYMRGLHGEGYARTSQWRILTPPADGQRPQSTLQTIMGWVGSTEIEPAALEQVLQNHEHKALLNILGEFWKTTVNNDILAKGMNYPALHGQQKRIKELEMALTKFTDSLDPAKVKDRADKYLKALETANKRRPALQVDNRGEGGITRQVVIDETYKANVQNVPEDFRVWLELNEERLSDVEPAALAIYLQGAFRHEGESPAAHKKRLVNFTTALSLPEGTFENLMMDMGKLRSVFKSQFGDTTGLSDELIEQQEGVINGLVSTTVNEMVEQVQVQVDTLQKVYDRNKPQTQRQAAQKTVEAIRGYVQEGTLPPDIWDGVKKDFTPKGKQILFENHFSDKNIARRKNLEQRLLFNLDNNQSHYLPNDIKGGLRTLGRKAGRAAFTTKHLITEKAAGFTFSNVKKVLNYGMDKWVRPMGPGVGHAYESVSQDEKVQTFFNLPSAKSLWENAPTGEQLGSAASKMGEEFSGGRLGYHTAQRMENKDDHQVVKMGKRIVGMAGGMGLSAAARYASNDSPWVDVATGLAANVQSNQAQKAPDADARQAGRTIVSQVFQDHPDLEKIVEDFEKYVNDARSRAELTVSETDLALRFIAQDKFKAFTRNKLTGKYVVQNPTLRNLGVEGKDQREVTQMAAERMPLLQDDDMYSEDPDARDVNRVRHLQQIAHRHKMQGLVFGYDYGDYKTVMQKLQDVGYFITQYALGGAFERGKVDKAMVDMEKHLRNEMPLRELNKDILAFSIQANTTVGKELEEAWSTDEKDQTDPSLNRMEFVPKIFQKGMVGSDKLLTHTVFLLEYDKLQHDLIKLENKTGVTAGGGLQRKRMEKIHTAYKVLRKEVGQMLQQMNPEDNLIPDGERIDAWLNYFSDVFFTANWDQETQARVARKEAGAQEPFDTISGFESLHDTIPATREGQGKIVRDNKGKAVTVGAFLNKIGAAAKITQKFDAVLHEEPPPQRKKKQGSWRLPWSKPKMD